MNDCTKEQQYWSNQNDIEEKPIHLSNYIYTNDCNDKNIKNNIDQLTIWQLEKCYSDDKYNAVPETSLNDLQEKVTLEKKNTNIEQCICINAWNQLKKVFELPDEELKTTNQLKSTFPDDTFYTMPIDLANDDCGDNLEEFLLDGEYIFKEDGDSNIIDLNKEAKTHVPENQLVIDKTEDEFNNDVMINHDKIQNKEIKNNNTKANYMVDTNKNKNILFNSVFSSEKFKRVNKKQNVKNIFKATLRPVKCCGVKFKVTKKKEKENNIKYVYTYGDHYRGGINYGHKDCVDCCIPIPRNKGWITNSFLESQRKKANEQRTLRVAREQQSGGKKQPENPAANERATRKNVTNHSVHSVGDVADAKRPLMTAKDEPLSVLELRKTHRMYTITMNPLTVGGEADNTTDPVVFRLGALDRTGGREDDAVSSCSSYELKFVPPAAINALRPQKTYHDVYTAYDKEHFQPTEKKRADKRKVTVVKN